MFDCIDARCSLLKYKFVQARGTLYRICVVILSEFGLNRHLRQYLVYANGEGSGETAHKRMFI